VFGHCAFYLLVLFFIFDSGFGTLVGKKTNTSRQQTLVLFFAHGFFLSVGVHSWVLGTVEPSLECGGGGLVCPPPKDTPQGTFGGVTGALTGGGVHRAGAWFSLPVAHLAGKL